MIKWSPTTWQCAELKLQMPVYDDIKKLKSIKKELNNHDGLIDLDEILSFKKKLKDVINKKNFIIIGGSCAESLNLDNATIDTIKTIQEMAKIVSKKNNKEIIKIGRMAGQYAKPRSNNYETINNITLPIYRGDIINDIDFSEESRKPNPNLMIKAFKRSIETINIIKSFDNNFFTSHEALLLDYEESLIRKKDNTFYLSSTHFPWIGDRTRNIKSSHIDFLSGIANPISIKCGINTDLEDLIQIIKKLNPKNEVGKIALTIRMGNKNIDKYYPILIDTILKNNLNVLWISDPMHGNTKIINNQKTRYLNDIEEEIFKFFSISKNKKIYPSGIHLEMIGKNITECIGLEVNENNLNKKYESLCDPRLNKEQSLYLAKKIFEFI